MGFGSSKSKSNNTSQQTSSSSNTALPFLQQQLGGQVSQSNDASNMIRNLLGLSGGTAGADAFNTYKDSAGYDFIKSEGLKDITAGAASKGLLQSGSALKAIQDRSTSLASTFLGDYLSRLTGQVGAGHNAAGIIAGAGNTSSSSGSSVGSSSNKSMNFNFG